MDAVGRAPLALVVEADRARAAELAATLAMAGYRVRAVADGLAATSELGPPRPDVVVVAARLPWVSGVAVGSLALALGSAVVLTGDAPPPDPGLPGAEFLAGPVDGERLLAAIARARGDPGTRSGRAA
jgi:CheY-like chemotaxis protein